MSRIKMFFMGSVVNWIKKYNANLRTKKIYGPLYSSKSDKINNLINKLRKNSYSVVGKLNAEGYYSCEPLEFDKRYSGEKIPLKIGTVWAKNTFDCMWVHCIGNVDNIDCDLKDIKLRIDLGGEGLVCDTQGKKIQGITTFVSEFDYTLGKPSKKIVNATELINDGKIEFWIDAAANDLFGKFQENAKIKSLDIVKENTQIRALAYDLEVLLSACDNADKDLADKYYKIIKEVYSKCKPSVTERVAEECRAQLRPLFEGAEDKFEYTAIGHGHLDLAWLWPLRESYRKGMRTFATQIMNMERYDDYYFGASQAQLFDWIKNLDSDLYAKVCDKVAAGRLEVQGATWVEMDSNLVSMESLIRQFYYGKKFFLKEFGLDMKILWLPDSFGYSSCLPQIMKLSNVPYFLTQKLSWNTTTKFPHHTFNWVGLDGSTVFAHMLPNNSYNSPNSADNLIFGANNFQEKDLTDKALTLFGIGDGGAGPGFEHIERARRLKNLSPVPSVKMGRAVDFFDSEVVKRDKFPIYQGELYLERHQGTYTTQALVKYYNRKCEFALRNYEYLACMRDECDKPIDKEELEKLWKEILLYQFHDILPGSSINRVYDECIPRYKYILDKLDKAIYMLLESLGQGRGFFNPNSYDVKHYFENNRKWYAVDVPKLSSASESNAIAVSDLVSAGNDWIENENIKIIFSKGEIKSYYDKKCGREFVAPKGKFLKYSLYSDHGDCWDMRKNYKHSRKKLRLVNFNISSDGVKACAKSEFAYNGIKIIQEVFLVGGEEIARVDIHIDNNRDRSMLRVEFDCDVYTDKCAFNTQNGHIYRATTENTKTEVAQFETSGQKFVDMSDGDFGIAVINDCKYGFRCKSNVIDMNLLRSPHNPAHGVDQGEFDVKIAIFTHSGSVNSDVYKYSYLLNNPIIDFVGGRNNQFTDVRLSNENIVLESVKVADNGGIIARLYNSSESPQEVSVNIGKYANGEIVNIIEEKIADYSDKLTLKAFEIINVRFFN